MDELKDKPIDSTPSVGDSRDKVASDLVGDLRDRGFPEQALGKVDDVIRSEQTGLTTETHESVAAEHGLVRKLGLAKNEVRGLEEKVHVRLNDITDKARSLITKLEQTLPAIHPADYAEQPHDWWPEITRSGTFVDESGKSMSVQVLEKNGKPSLVLSDPDNPECKITIDKSSGTIGLFPKGIGLGPECPNVYVYREGTRRFSKPEGEELIIVESPEFHAMSENAADPLDVADKALSFLATASLKQ